MPRTVALAVLVAAIGIGACGGSDSKKKTTTSTATAAPAEQTTAAGCTKVAQPEPRGEQHLQKPSSQLSASKRWVVKLQTNCGDISIRLDVKRAPKTASSVAALVRRGFYDGLTFHRVVADFVIQGGDPLGNGQGGPGYTVVEKPPMNTAYTRGVVAMAKSQVDPAGASGSQFYIVTGQDAGLPAIYAIVGRVTGSTTAMDRIAATPTNAGERPLDPVVIEKATLSES